MKILKSVFKHAGQICWVEEILPMIVKYKIDEFFDFDEDLVEFDEDGYIDNSYNVFDGVVEMIEQKHIPLDDLLKIFHLGQNCFYVYFEDIARFIIDGYGFVEGDYSNLKKIINFFNFDFSCLLSDDGGEENFNYTLWNVIEYLFTFDKFKIRLESLESRIKQEDYELTFEDCEILNKCVF